MLGWWRRRRRPRAARFVYYTPVFRGRSRANPAGVIRRRWVNGRSVEEAFTRNLVWESTHAMYEAEIGRSDQEFTQITAREAEEFVQRVTAKIGRYITEPSPGVTMRININDATIHDGRYHYRGEPFNGRLVQTDDAGAVIEMTSVLHGVAHGIVQQWYPDSTMRSKTIMRDGVPTGTAYTWHPNGQLAEIRDFDNEGQTVRVRRWDENGAGSGDP